MIRTVQHGLRLDLMKDLCLVVTPTGRKFMNIHEWIEYGIKNKFCSAAVCNTHEGLPQSDKELDEWDQGGDPCVYGLRLYEQE